jgi:hypothetical protein
MEGVYRGEIEMFKRGKYGIVDVIGVTLIVMALVSAGGIYYTANTYVKINDTWTNCRAFVPEVNITSSDTTTEVTFQITLFIDNPSSLDIEIVSSNVEYNVYVFDTEPDFSLLDYDDWLDHFITPGRGMEGGNGTVEADSQKTLFLLTNIGESPPLYWERFEDSSTNGRTFVVLNGFALYNIIEFPTTTEKMWFGYTGWVSVYEQ